MSENLKLIKSLMPDDIDLVELINSDTPAAAFGAGRHMAPDMEVVFAATRSGAPGLHFSGVEGLTEGWRDWLTPYHTYRIKPEEFIDAGDSVVVHVHVTARTERHGVDIEHRPSSVWTVKDGNVVSVYFFLDRTAALEFAGVA